MNNLPYDLHELSLFKLVADVGSITGAAGRAGLSQSALSRQIQGLESRIGQQLLERTTRTQRLTDAGRFWLEQANRLLRQANLAWDDFAERHLGSAKLRIGICRSIGLAYLPGFLHAFRKNSPDCQVSLIQESESELSRRLREGEIDLAILTKPRIALANAVVELAFEDKFVAVAPPDSGIEWDDLGEQPLILLEAGTTTGELIRNWLSANGIEPNGVMETDNFDLIVNSVALGLGCALIPRRALTIYSKSRKVRKLGVADGLSREIQALVRPGAKESRMLRSFIDQILFQPSA